MFKNLIVFNNLIRCTVINYLLTFYRMLFIANILYYTENTVARKILYLCYILSKKFLLVIPTVLFSHGGGR